MHNQAGCGKGAFWKEGNRSSDKLHGELQKPFHTPRSRLPITGFPPWLILFSLVWRVHFCVCMWKPEEDIGHPALPLSPEKESLAEPWRPPSSSDSLDSSALPSAGLQVIPASSVLCMGTRDSNSGPHGSAANVLTHGAISPPLSIDFLCSFL